MPSDDTALPNATAHPSGARCSACLFPNPVVSAHPDYVLAHRFEPSAVDATQVECSWLFPPEALEQPSFDPTYAVEPWDVTNERDWAACESVQRGAASRGYRSGPLSAKESSLAGWMATSPPATAPAGWAWG